MIHNNNYSLCSFDFFDLKFGRSSFYANIVKFKLFLEKLLLIKQAQQKK